jgi:hypothetical protein
MSVDLPTLLLFTGVALIVSYFQIPIGREEAELSLEGAILLGAALAGGLVLGGWAAFITGLATPMKRIKGFLPASIVHRTRRLGRHPSPENMSIHAGWVENASVSVLSGGRNVVAIAVAWTAYRGMGGTLAPTTIDTRLALALIILCVVYALIRCLWGWPAILLQSAAPQQTLMSIVHPAAILVELAPLPVSLLTSATFAQLGRSFFLLLALVFIGLGAVMRQMIETIYAMRVQIDTLTLRDRVRQAIANTPRELDALIPLAHRLCREIVRAAKFEIGLYKHHTAVDGEGDHVASGLQSEASDGSSFTHVSIQVAVHNNENLPPIRVPITPLWAWLSELREPLLVRTEAQLQQLPFTLPPLNAGKGPQAAMFVPLTSVLLQRGSQEDSKKPAPRQIGAFVFQSAHPDAFSISDMEQIALVADQIAAALGTLTERPHVLSPSSARTSTAGTG